MKKVYRMLVLGMLAGLVFGGMLWAEDGDRNGVVSGIFVRLVERAVGERGYMGIVIKPFERDDHVTVLVPRQREELWQAARRLQEGQKVGVSFVTEAGHKWIKGMEAERREVVEEGLEGRRRVSVRREVLRYEGDQERREPKRPAHLGQMEGQLKEVVSGHLERMGRALKEVLGEHLERMEAELRELRAHIERMQEELQELRAENERLKWQLRERGGPEREREREVRRRRVVEEQREGREREERERRRERDEGRARRERPKSEREVVLHQLEVMRMALPALREAERGDAVELLTLAIRAREVMLEGRKDEEAQSIRERAPNREQLIEILSVAAKLWREFGNAEKSAAIGQLAEQLSGARRRQVREHEERKVRRRRVERREIGLPDGMVGFRGVLVGRVLRKLDRGFVLKVERVTKVWEHNRADKPEAAVGKELIITIRADDELSGRFLRTLRALEIGERVLVEAFHFEGNRLTVVEQLQRAD
jgi:regulator of replication initiation timing